jgi:hypothetical protein
MDPVRGFVGGVEPVKFRNQMIAQLCGLIRGQGGRRRRTKFRLGLAAGDVGSVAIVEGGS